jgi:hypothetical protein
MGGTYLHVEFLPSIRLVDRHMLNAHQVLAGWYLSRQLEGKLALVPGEPSLVCPIPRDLGADLIHLDSIARAVVFTDIAWRLRQVSLIQKGDRLVRFAANSE